MKQASNELAKLGFNMGVDNTPFYFGTMTPEPFWPVRAAQWKPLFRHVFIGTCVDGFYITSHIKGYLREKYERCEPYEMDFRNIFGGGSTLKEAIDIFISNFASKTYNIITI
jgi:hypothetical protein